jgi:hypothetical protein
MAGMTREVSLQLAETVDELAGLPLGTRIATNTNKVLILDEAWGRSHWIEEGSLEPFFQPRAVWLPAIILPPVKSDVEGPAPRS